MVETIKPCCPSLVVNLPTSCLLRMKMQSRLDDDLLTDGASKRSSWSCAKAQESPYWNIFFLAIAWAGTLTTSTLLTSIGPLTAKKLGASTSIAAFTVGCFLIGAAVSSVPSGAIFRKYGRKLGFSFGSLFQLIGSGLGAISVLGDLLPMLFLGCFFVGLSQGLGQFYRFSAVEVSPDYLKSRAVTYVLSGGIIAAFLGPTCASYTSELLDTEYLASFLFIGVFAAINQGVVLLVNFPPPIAPKDIISAEVSNKLVANALTEESLKAHTKDSSMDPAPLDNFVQRESQMSMFKIRSAREIVTQPMFIVSCTVATLAHTIMIMIMSNVSVAMDDSGYGLSKSSMTLQFHFLAMFGPGFFTGSLIERYGTFSVALLGALIFTSSSFVLAIGDEVWNYSLGMVLSGLGWNFAFSAGTVMLTSCYKPVEATEVQAYNDFIIFSVAGGGSLISGVIYATYGWLFLIYLVSGMMAVYLALFAVMWKYAPDESDEEEGDENEDCCSLLGGGNGGAVGGAPSAQNSVDFTRGANTERGTVDDAERGHHGARAISHDTRPTVGGALGFGSGSAPAGYDINSRNSSFASVRSDRSARKNSIAEVGLRIALG